METLTVPFMIIVGGVIAWMSFITVKTFQNEKAIAINIANDAAVGKAIDEVKEDVTRRIDRLEEHVNRKFDRIFDEIKNLTRK